MEEHKRRWQGQLLEKTYLKSKPKPEIWTSFLSTHGPGAVTRISKYRRDSYILLITKFSFSTYFLIKLQGLSNATMTKKISTPVGLFISSHKCHHKKHPFMVISHKNISFSYCHQMLFDYTGDLSKTFSRLHWWTFLFST